MLCSGVYSPAGVTGGIGNSPISSVTDFSAVPFLATANTLNPLLASWIAYSRPIPSEAPVTTIFRVSFKMHRKLRGSLTGPTPLPSPELFQLIPVSVSTYSERFRGETHADSGEDKGLAEHGQGFDCKLEEGETSQCVKKRTNGVFSR